MKRFFKFLGIAVVTTVAIWACSDSFSEEDLIKFQLDLKVKQDSITVAKMNDAGQLLSYTIQVLEDKVPVSGVTITMSNPPVGSTSSPTASTDVNGFATFTSVRMGSNAFVLSRTGYYPATFIVNFGNPVNGTNYLIVNNSLVPIKLNASSQVPIFGTAGTGETGIIKGTVTIETDLTNMEPEVPQDLTLRANLVGVTGNFGGGANDPSSGTNATLVQYYFNSSNVGTAVVDNATGAYSMTLPASTEGREYTFIYPTITTTQKVGYRKLNAQPIDPIVSTTVPVSFGPDLTYDEVPSISGAMATFTPASPAAAGQGVRFNLTPYPRSISPGSLFSYNVSSTTIGNATYQLTNRGSGYTSAPAVTVTGGGATTQATMRAALTGLITEIGVVNAGTGYTGNVNFRLQISDDNGLTFYDAYDPFLTLITFNRDVGLTPTGIAGVSLPATGSGIDSTRPFSAVLTGIINGNPSIAYGITTFRWVITGNGTGASASPVVSCGIERLQITSVGAGYTSAPTITINAPGVGTQATVSVEEFQTQWFLTIDNSSNTTPYMVVPDGANITFSVNNSTFVNSVIIDQLGVNSSLYNALTVSGGNLVFADPTRTYRTSGFSQVAPVVLIVPVIPEKAAATVRIGSGISEPTFGLVTSLDLVNNGVGYHTPISVVITALNGLSGSGARADLAVGITYNSTTKVYYWNGASYILNRGSGYQPFANMYYMYPPYGITLPVEGSNTDPVPFLATIPNNTKQVVRAGEVLINNVMYGTGDRHIEILN